MNNRQLISLALVINSILVYSDTAQAAASATLKTEVRTSGQPTATIPLLSSQVFTLHGFSVGGGDKVKVIFTIDGNQKFNLSPIGWVTSNAIPELVRDPGAGVPIRGPGSVSISGKGLVSYSIEIAK